MHITMVNHASFIVEEGDVRLLADPWLEGTAFDNGWALLSETSFTYEDFSGITHIWFSHEHPDHFVPSNLRKIPLAYRQQITVLYQATHDKKVIEYCKGLEFKEVIELDPDAWLLLSDRVSVLCRPYPVGDSWLCVKTPEQTLLNVNDCEIYTPQAAQEIKQKIGAVDVLLTQFSYAGAAGNREDIELRRERAKLKLDRVRTQIECFRPPYVVPIASFVWFCHEENHYMNDAINQVGDVSRLLAEQTTASPVVLYPADTWEIGTAHDSDISIAKYDRDYAKLAQDPPLLRAKTIPLEELQQSALTYTQKLKNLNNRFLLNKMIKPMAFYLTDTNQAVLLTLDNGLQTVNKPYHECDLALSSEALNYCMNFLWGFGTLGVNGRFQAPKGHPARFTNTGFGAVSALNNIGLRLGFNLKFARFAVEYARKKLVR